MRLRGRVKYCARGLVGCWLLGVGLFESFNSNFDLRLYERFDDSIEKRLGEM